MKFELTEKHMDEISADFEAIFIVGENLKHKFIKDADQFDFYNYKGDGILVLPQNRRIYVGIKALKYDAVRLGAAKIIQNQITKNRRIYLRLSKALI